MLTVYVYDANKLEDAIHLCDTASPYGLTAAVFAQDRKAIQHLTHAFRYEEEGRRKWREREILGKIGGKRMRRKLEMQRYCKSERVCHLLVCLLISILLLYVCVDDRHLAGNFYINDKSTGAVVGQQPYGGARLVCCPVCAR